MTVKKMLPLILLTFSVFFTLWAGDFYITYKTVKHVGPKAELNPIIRVLMQTRGKNVWVFKTFEIALFLYLIYYIQTFSGESSFYILLGYIFFYSILVFNNSWVFFKVTKMASKAFGIIFLITSFLLIMFIYLNYLMYSGLTLTYKKFGECQLDYKNLYWECYQKNITHEKSQELEDILGNLDIKIPNP